MLHGLCPWSGCGLLTNVALLSRQKAGSFKLYSGLCGPCGRSLPRPWPRSPDPSDHDRIDHPQLSFDSGFDNMAEKWPRRQRLWAGTPIAALASLPVPYPLARRRPRIARPSARKATPHLRFSTFQG